MMARVSSPAGTISKGLKPGLGLIGDHRALGESNPKNARQVTLIQWEHFSVIASLLGLQRIDPELLRRNIAVSGINLLGLKNKRFRIGECELEGTGLCHPCSRMEEVFGPGGYNAVRGHGGLTARVIKGGEIAVGDTVVFSA